METVVDALRLAALPADQQAAALPDFVFVPDEVVLLYEDAWLLVPLIRNAGLISDEQFDSLSRLDQHFEEMSNARDKDSLLTVEAMIHDDRWKASRRLAEEALRALGATPGSPRFDGVTWIRGRA